MESWQQILAAYPLLRIIWDAAAIMAPLAALFAYSGVFFLSSAATIVSVSSKRSAYSKCSVQMAQLGLILGWTLLVGSRIWLYYTQSAHESGTMVSFLLEMSWLLFSMGVLLGSIFYSLRNTLKNMPILHVALGMIAAVQNCVALVVVLFTLRIISAAINPEAAHLALPDLFPSNWDDPLWSAFCYALPLALAMPGAWAACWLVMRRNKDDYGRDYYNTMIPWCAAWARNAWLVLWLLLLVSTALQVWQEMQKSVFNAQGAMIDNARILIWLLPPVFWTIVKRSAIPIRQSWLLFAALIFAALFMIPYYLQLAVI